MKKFEKISLHNLSKAELQKKEMNAIKGGVCGCACVCLPYCGCKYAGDKESPYDSYYGGSSIQANSDTNARDLENSNTTNGVNSNRVS